MIKYYNFSVLSFKYTHIYIFAIKLILFPVMYDNFSDNTNESLNQSFESIHSDRQNWFTWFRTDQL